MVIMNMFKKNNGLLPFGIKSANSLLASLDNGTSHAHPYIPYGWIFYCYSKQIHKNTSHLIHIILALEGQDLFYINFSYQFCWNVHI